MVRAAAKDDESRGSISSSCCVARSKAVGKTARRSVVCCNVQSCFQMDSLSLALGKGNSSSSTAKKTAADGEASGPPTRLGSVSQRLDS